MKLLYVLVLVHLKFLEGLDDDFDPNVDVFPDAHGAAQSSQFGSVYRDGRVRDEGHTDPEDDLVVPEKVKYSDLIKQSWLTDPRDKVLEDARRKKTFKKPEQDPMWFDFPRLQEQNFVNRFSPPKKDRRKEEYRKRIEVDRKEEKDKYFRSNSFMLNTDNTTKDDGLKEDRIIYTTCDEFKKGASFHPDDIVDMQWIPFYTWTLRHFIPFAHNFSIPTIKLVKEFKEKYAPHIKVPVNWDQPKIYLYTIQYELLLIAVDRSGLFYGIPKIKPPSFPSESRTPYSNFPVWLVRFKIVDPYLMMMHCSPEDPYCVIMATESHLPGNVYESIFHARSTGFQGPGSPVKWYRESEDYILAGREFSAQNLKKRAMLPNHPSYGMFGPEETKRKRKDNQILEGMEDRMWFETVLQQERGLNELRKKHQRELQQRRPLTM